MKTLPSLPGCGQPATVRIEIYSPGPSGNAYGSLDAVAYACGDHLGAILAMLDDAGLTGHVDPDPNAARDMGRPCGHLFRLDAPVDPAGPADHNGEPAAGVSGDTPDQVTHLGHVPAAEIVSPDTILDPEPSGDGSPASVAAFIARNHVPVPGPVQHPRWCLRTDHGDVHRGHLVDVGDDLTVRIEQPYGDDEPVIVLRPAGRPELALPGDVAAALCGQLRVAVSLAGMGR